MSQSDVCDPQVQSSDGPTPSSPRTLQLKTMRYDVRRRDTDSPSHTHHLLYSKKRKRRGATFLSHRFDLPPQGDDLVRDCRSQTTWRKNSGCRHLRRRTCKVPDAREHHPKTAPRCFWGDAEAEDDDGWMEAQGGSLDAEIARREEEVRQHASGSSRKAAADGGPQHQRAGVPSVDGDDGSGSDSGGEGQGGGSTQARVQVSACLLAGDRSICRCRPFLATFAVDLGKSRTRKPTIT